MAVWLSLRLCFVLLCTLFLMHIYWFGLFIRIAARLIGGGGAKQAGREEYEGDSGAESSGADEGDEGGVSDSGRAAKLAMRKRTSKAAD